MIRARRLLPDDTFSELDSVINTEVEGAQSQPALPVRAVSSLVFAWTSPDASSVGVVSRAMLLSCPSRTTNDFYADPLADRTIPGLPAPNGSRSPAVCAYPRLTAGGGGPASVRLLGAADRTGAGGALAGLTLEALTAQLSAAQSAILAGDIERARHILERLRLHLDGCEAGASADHDDWITLFERLLRDREEVLDPQVRISIPPHDRVRIAGSHLDPHRPPLQVAASKRRHFRACLTVVAGWLRARPLSEGFPRDAKSNSAL